MKSRNYIQVSAVIFIVVNVFIYRLVISNQYKLVQSLKFRLSEIGKLNNQIDKQALYSKQTKVISYDELVRLSVLIDDRERSLMTFLSKKEDFDEVRQEVKNLSFLIKKKKDLLERFKSKNSILRNSLNSLGLLLNDKIHSDVPQDLLIMEGSLIKYSLYGNYRSIDLLREEVKNLKIKHELSSPNFKMLFLHADVVLNLNPEVDNILDQLLKMEITASADKIMTHVDRISKRYLKNLKRSVFFFIVLNILLFLILSMAINRLSKKSKELASFNESLEEKIKNRTIELSEVNSFQNAILNSTKHAIISTDVNGTIKSFNKGAEHLLGYEMKEVVDLKSLSLFHDEEELANRRESLPEELKNYVKSDFDVLVIKAREFNVADEREWNYVRKDGSELPILLSITCLRNTEKKIIGYLGIAVDYSEQKAFIQQIQKKNKELNQFSYIVSHDLKAPLRAISTLSTFIEQDLEGKLEGETKSNFNLLRKRTERMKFLIDDILKYSKVGKQNTGSESIHLYELVSDIKEELTFPEEMRIEIDPDLPTIFAPRIFMHQIFSNLMNNAIKYHNKKDGLVKIGFYDLKKNILIFVRDNGPGVREQFKDKIFEIFQTIEKTDNPESTGIGLSIVKKMVEELNGKIWMESDYGEGSTFLLSFNHTMFESKPVKTIEI